MPRSGFGPFAPRQNRTPHVPVEETPLASDLPSADAIVTAAELHIVAMGCLEKLAELQRNVVSLRLLEELSGAETAAALGLTQQYVAVILGRAKLTLRRCMDDEHGDGEDGAF